MIELEDLHELVNFMSNLKSVCVAQDIQLIGDADGGVIAVLQGGDEIAKIDGITFNVIEV